MPNSKCTEKSGKEGGNAKQQGQASQDRRIDKSHEKSGHAKQQWTDESSKEGGHAKR